MQQQGDKTLHVAGDTLWNQSVEQAIVTYHPEVIVRNAGDVRFKNIGGAIIMGRAASKAAIAASHLAALKHATKAAAN